MVVRKRMSSHPTGLRFSSFSSSSPPNNGNLSPTTIVTKNLQPQPQQGNNINNNNNNSNNNTLNKKSTSSSTSSPLSTAPTTRNQFTTTNSLSGSETDISTSTENLSMEQRYVLKHTPRVEPQGQENLQETVTAANENKGRFGPEQRFSSNVSTDSTRYASSNRSLSEARNPIFAQPNNGTNTSNRNSLKEVNSNRSSMDVSTCSYNTLIIHNDDSMYSIANRDYPSPPPMTKKERPRSYGEPGMQEITEIPDDYLNQSHVLKHLANEIKLPAKNRTNTGHKTNSEPHETKDNQGIEWIMEEPESPNKSKSKSQPDLTKLPTTDADKVNALLKENTMLKQQLIMCNMKVAKTQKLEEEVAKVYRVYEELVQSCDRREKLERVARMRLQENLQKVQTLNRALKDQVDIFQSQLLAPSEHQILIAQLFSQNKELCAAKERQDIELAAQQETLQEQRTHIGILDTALTNAQRNIRRLEEELRKKQICIDRLTQLCGANKAKQNDCKVRLDYETELSKDSNRSGSSTNSDSKWQLQEKNSQIMRLESEARHLEEQHALRQNASKLSLEKTSQETDRIIAEAKHDKLRCLEEVHSAQRKVGDLQSHLKVLESRLAEKDALIRALQNQKISGSSFDSYNLSTDSYALHPLRYNSPSSFNASNNSFNVAANVLLDTNAYGGVSVSPSSTAYNHHQVAMNGLSTPTAYGQTAPTYNHQSVVNLQSISIPGNYSPNSSNYSASYDPNSNYMTQNSPTFNTSSYVDNQYDEHMKKQIDEQLSKVSQLSLMQNSARASSKMLDQAIVGLNPKNNIILSQIHVSNELAKSCRTICNSKETFY